MPSTDFVTSKLSTVVPHARASELHSQHPELWHQIPISHKLAENPDLPAISSWEYPCILRSIAKLSFNMTISLSINQFFPVDCRISGKIYTSAPRRYSSRGSAVPSAIRTHRFRRRSMPTTPGNDAALPRQQ